MTISPAEILQTLTFIMQNFLWLDVVPRVKSFNLSNVAMVVLWGIWRTGS